MITHERHPYYTRLQLSDDGTVVVYSGYNPHLQAGVIYGPTGLTLCHIPSNIVTNIRTGFEIDEVKISANNRYFYAREHCTTSGCSYLYDVSDSTSTCFTPSRAAAFSNSSDLLATIRHPYGVQIWDLSTRQCRAMLDGDFDDVRVIKFSPSNRSLALLNKGGTIIIWEIGSRDTRTLSPPSSSDNTFQREIVFSEDESMIACTRFTESGRERDRINVEYEFHVDLWHLGAQERLETIESDWCPYGRRTLSFSEDGRYLRTYLSYIDLQPSSPFFLDLERPVDVDTRSRWIKWHGKRILPLPDDYVGQMYDAWGNTLVIRNERGGITVIDFDRQALREALGL